MRQAELEKYKRILEDKQNSLLQNTAQRDAITVERSADIIDELQSATDRELAITELDLSTRLLRNVKAALGRIEDESFGICVRCEQPIGVARLNAIPWAPFCIKCQEELDEGGAAERERFSEFFSDAA